MYVADVFYLMLVAMLLIDYPVHYLELIGIKIMALCTD